MTYWFFSRYFWLRWKDERLQVGIGAAVGRRLLMEYSKPGHPEIIRSVGMSTGWEETGRWQVSSIEGIFLLTSYHLSINFPSFIF